MDVAIGIGVGFIAGVFFGFVLFAAVSINSRKEKIERLMGQL